jgi:hypothetical protein
MPNILPREAMKFNVPITLPRICGVVTSVSSAAQPTSDIDQKNSRTDKPKIKDRPAVNVLPVSISDLCTKYTAM